MTHYNCQWHITIVNDTSQYDESNVAQQFHMGDMSRWYIQLGVVLSCRICSIVGVEWMGTEKMYFQSSIMME